MEFRDLYIDRKYLLLPVNNKALTRRVRLVQGGRSLRSFCAPLGLPAHWWAHVDVSDWHGTILTVTVDNDDTPPLPYLPLQGRGAAETDNADIVMAIQSSTDVWSPETLYREPHRPIFHFSCGRGWSNDPNGLMFHEGKYHMFYQHNPHGLCLGNTHWGHAISPDLVHWQELPIALYPRDDNDFPFSGAGAVDTKNSSGWGKGDNSPMVIAFTSTGRGECIAYSNDGGARWTEFSENPVVEHDGRDPKLLWHGPTQRWVMVVYSVRPGETTASPKHHGLTIFTSHDLKTWQERSWIDGHYECPDLFELAIDDDPSRKSWVLSSALGYYEYGKFDGATFTSESARLPGPSGGGPSSSREAHILDLLPRVYAAQTFSGHPDQHVVQIAWAVVEPIDAPFTMMMSFPTRLSLRTTSDGIRLCRDPVDTIKSLRTKTYDIAPVTLGAAPLLTDLEGEAWDLEMVVRLGTASPLILSIAGDEYIYRPGPQMLFGPDGAMLIAIPDGRLRIRALIDRTTIEIFGGVGEAYGMFRRSVHGGKAALSLRTWDIWSEDIKVETMRAHALRSVWDKQTS